MGLTCLVSLFTKMDTNAQSSKHLWENSVTWCCHSTMGPLITTSPPASQTFRVRRTPRIARQWQYCKTCKKSPLRPGELRLMFTLKSKVSEPPSVAPSWCECMSFLLFASVIIIYSRRPHAWCVYVINFQDFLKCIISLLVFVCLQMLRCVQISRLCAHDCRCCG